MTYDNLLRAARAARAELKKQGIEHVLVGTMALAVNGAALTALPPDVDFVVGAFPIGGKWPDDWVWRDGVVVNSRGTFLDVVVGGVKVDFIVPDESDKNLLARYAAQEILAAYGGLDFPVAPNASVWRLKEMASRPKDKAHAAANR